MDLRDLRDTNPAKIINVLKTQHDDYSLLTLLLVTVSTFVDFKHLQRFFMTS